MSENRFYEILRHKPGKELLRLLSFWKEERDIYVFEAFLLFDCGAAAVAAADFLLAF